MSIDTADDRKQAAFGNLSEYIHRLIAVRRERSSDDLLSVMVRARDEGDRLSEDELFSLFLAIFLAGFETTAAQLGSTVYALMTHRHLWQELLDDRTIMPAALEELWRWIPSFRHGMPRIRWAKEDVELSGGVVVPAGEAVLPEHQVANRDESVFPHGWELDFHRVDPAPHLSLAFGAHLCLGAQLAHLEIEVTLEKLLQRFPTLELAIPSDDVEWSSSTFLRTPAALPLTW
jgi:cytochrome P450